MRAVRLNKNNEVAAGRLNNELNLTKAQGSRGEMQIVFLIKYFPSVVCRMKMHHQQLIFIPEVCGRSVRWINIIKGISAQSLVTLTKLDGQLAATYGHKYHEGESDKYSSFIAGIIMPVT